MAEDIKVEVVKNTSKKPLVLDPFKLSLISFGSLAGMGIGLLLSFVVTSNIYRLIFAGVLLFLSLSSIFKNINSLQ